MKKALLVIVIILSLAAVIIVSLATCSKQQKIGYYNSSEVLKDNPVVKRADSTLALYVKQLEQGYNEMKDELAAKQAAFKKDSASLNETTRGVISKDIATLQKKVDNYSSDANVKLTQVQNEAYKPITDKLNEAIKEVAKAGGYDYVFEVNNVRFAYSDTRYDLTQDIKDRFVSSK